MKVLNLYAGLGGNRQLWEDVEVTAVEIDEQTASFYKHTFPDDRVIIGDAHEYLLENFNKFDFIWTSPPCQSHSSFRQNIGVRYRGVKPIYPDMRLWQEIIFLKANCENKFVVENVRPYYKPLVEPDADLHRHLFWCNFNIDSCDFDAPKIRAAQIPDLQKAYNIDLSGWEISDKRQKLRNCVLPELGLHILRGAHGC